MSGKRKRCSSEWKTAKLGEVLPLKYGKARNEQFGFTREETQTYGSNGAFGSYDRALTSEPSLIVGRKGAAGAVHYSPDPCWPIDTAFYTEGNDATHLPFFRYLLESLNLGRLDQSTAIPSLSRDVYDSTEVCFPESIEEQRRIVAEIEKQFSRLDEGVAALKRAQANLKRYRAAVLKTACEGRLVPTETELARASGKTFETGEQLLERILAERRQKWQGRGKYKEPAAPAATNLPALPDGWVWAELGQLAWSVKDGPHYSPKYTSVGIPFISGGNIKPSGVDFANAKRITPELHAELSRRCKPEFGDLLYTKGGTTGIARVNTYAEEFNVWVHVAVLKLVDSVNRFYVQHTLNSPFCYAQAQKFTHGVGNQDLGLTRMIHICLAIPPLAEQKRIVAEVERRLSVIDELESAVSSNLQRAARLRQAVLQKAFKGEL